MNLATRNSDDPDAHVTYTLTERNGNTLDFTPVVTAVRLGSSATLDATWEGDAAATRDLRVDLAGFTTPGGYWDLWLAVPGDNDIKLGAVRMTTLVST